MAPTSHSSLRREVGARLRSLRLRSGIGSQEKLAERADVHRTYVGRLERGESGVTVDMLTAILAAMEVSLGEFFRPFNEPMKSRTPRKRG